MLALPLSRIGTKYLDGTMPSAICLLPVQIASLRLLESFFSSSYQSWIAEKVGGSLTRITSL